MNDHTRGTKYLSETPAVAPSATVRHSTLGAYTEVREHSTIDRSNLGDYSYVMERCDISHTVIGKFVNIAAEVRVNPGNHPVDWVSQHHFLYRRRQYGFAAEDLDRFFAWRRLQQVRIGHDCWLGHRAIIMPDVTIGNGAVVGAGAVVTKDVAPYSIVAGVPAKPLRSRFPESIWRALEETAWWDWGHETLRERLADFYDVRLFLERYGQGA